MFANALKCNNNVWYVDSESGDDTTHPIVDTEFVPLLLQDGNVKYLVDVLHVPSITKNLVSVEQMVEQGLQVRFNADGLYVEEYKKNGKLIAQGKKVDRMFTLDVNIPKVNDVMFAHGSGVVADIEIWHKRIGHANVQRLKTMQSQELVTGLPVFKVTDMQKLCEACQFGKQAKAAFPHDKHVSKNVLELVNSDVWGLAKTASMGGCRFYVTFIDDHTRKVWVYFMKEKNVDWAGSVCDRQSTSGFMFSLGSAAITWSSQKQPTVALSSTEVEYRGAAVAACEVALLELLLGDLGIHVQRLVAVHCDNLSSIQLAQNPVFHARTKHIEVHYHFIRERVLDGSIDLTFVRTDEQVADIFTKALVVEKLRRFQVMLGIQELALSLRGSVEISSSTHDPPG
ncbi:hypothetical protein L7F22_050751 [Adiantum nelumboides]|nr:hypothetical protein [Adiantum nelumboides]